MQRVSQIVEYPISEEQLVLLWTIHNGLYMVVHIYTTMAHDNTIEITGVCWSLNHPLVLNEPKEMGIVSWERAYVNMSKYRILFTRRNHNGATLRWHPRSVDFLVAPWQLDSLGAREMSGPVPWHGGSEAWDFEYNVCLWRYHFLHRCVGELQVSTYLLTCG